MLVRLSSLAAVRCASSLSRALVRRSASSPVSGVASFSTGRAVRSSSVLSNDLLLSVAMNSQAAQTARSQAEMCAQLRASGAIKSDRVADAIGRVDRRYFARPPAGLQQEAKEEEEEEEEDVSPYTHAPSPIGQLATISSPYSHALALEALESSGALQSATRVLDVGSGSGYLTACLALLADTRARVVALEHSGVLLAQSKLNLESEHDTAKLVARRPAEDAGISFVQGNAGDDALAWIERSPMREFDVVHVGVAFPRMPLHLLRLLRVGGRMLVPVGQAPPAGEGQQLLLVEKLSNLEEEGVGYHTTPIMACSYATIALEAPPSDVDSVGPILRERDAIQLQLDAHRKALFDWQRAFVDRNQLSRKPTAAEMKSDPVAAELMAQVAPLVKRKAALDRVVARFQTGEAVQE